MSQDLVPMKPLHVSANANTVIDSVANIVTVSQVDLKQFEVPTPVKIMDGKLHVNENMLEKDRIYSVTHNKHEYFIRRHKGATEIFQLTD